MMKKEKVYLKKKTKRGKPYVLGNKYDVKRGFNGYDARTLTLHHHT